MVRRSRDAARSTFNSVVTILVTQKTPQDIKYLKVLAETLSTAEKTQMYNCKVKVLEGIQPEQRKNWIDAWNLYCFGDVAYQEGKSTENPYKLDEALSQFKKAVALFEETGDTITTAEVMERLAWCHDTLKDGYEACVHFLKALELFKVLEFTHPSKATVESKYNAYIQKKYDPTKPRDEGGEPPPEEEGEDGSVAGAPKTAEFKLGDVTEEWILKYTPMKNPADFMTPGYNTGYNPLLWPTSWFDTTENNPMRFEPYFAYSLTFFGQQINISKDGSKFYFDIDGNAQTRTEAKILNKPIKVVLEGTEKGADKKPYRYQFYIQAPGEQESQFGIEMNNSTGSLEKVSLRSRTGCSTKGKVLKDNFTLIDDNCSGIFGDTTSYGKDYITHSENQHWRPDAVLIGREKKARPFSHYMKFGDKFYYVSSDVYGQKITTIETEVVTGTVSLDWTGKTAPLYLVLRLLDDANPGVFFDIAGSKEG